MTEPRRCDWANSSDAMRAYHDDEWGRATHDERELFRMLVLEGAQAGLSWATILNRRAGYDAAFDGFDVQKIARYDDAKIAALLADERIIRNRLKVAAAVRNARATIALYEAGGSLDAYFWGLVDGRPIVNRPRTMADVPAVTPLAEAASRDLKRRGFTFVGPTIVYSYLQSIGVVDDHLACCAFKPHPPA